MKTYTNISREISFILIACLSAIAVYGEGTKQVAPSSSDVVALLVNNSSYGDFARFNSSDFERLYIRIQNPSVDRIYLGFSRSSSTPGATPGTTAYFRIRRPDGTVVFGPEVIDNTHEIESYTEAVNGPDGIDGVSTAGYTPYIYDPSGNPAGDYWVEFLSSSTQSSQNTTSFFFNWFDITVANGTSSMPGRVWSKRWGLALPDANTNFNGAFYVFAPEIGGTTPVGPFQKAGYVSKIDFTGSGFRPWYFNVAFNGTGPGTSGNVANDRKSVSGLAMAPSYEVFLTEPDVNIWENGSFGTVTGQVTTTRCGERSICLNVSVTQTGDLEALIDANPPGSPDGIYTPGTADRIIAYNVTPGTGESPPYTRCVPWDGLDGLGNIIGTVGVVPVVISYSQAAFHFPVFDVEENEFGWNVISVRPTPPPGFQLKFYWDDSNISYSSNTGSPNVNLTGCTPATPPGASGCHTWNLFDDGNNNTPQYGNLNTINTWWYLQRIAIPVAVTIPDYIVPEGPPDATIDPFITFTEPLDGSFVYHLGGNFEENDKTWWETLGSGTFTPDNIGVETDYTPSPADIIAGSVKIVMHIGGRCDNPTDTATLSFVYPIDAALSVTQNGNEAGPVPIIYTVTLNRPNNTGVPITFDFDDSGTGTASSGSDYTAISPTAKISVAQGATTGTFTVTVINDVLCETTETVNAVISNPSSSRIATISTPSATADILDNENGSTGGTATPAASPICSGSTTTVTVTGYTGTIQWEQSANGTSGWGNVSGGSGSTTATYTTPALTATTYYRARVTSGACPSAYSTVAQVSVDQLSSGGTAIVAASPICTGSSTTVTVSGYTGTIQWEQSANGSTGWANVTGGTGATTPTYTTPNLTVTTWYRAMVTNGVCSSSGSNAAQVSIDQLSVGGTATPAASPICSGSSTTVTVTGYTGSIQWEQSPNGSSGWGNVSGGSGATTSTYTTPTLTATTWYRAKVTYGTCNPAYSTTALVTINPTSVGGTATAAVSPICSGSSTTVTVTGYTGTIQWQQSADGSTGWATVTGGSGGTTATYTTPNLTATTYYRAAVTSGVCSTVNSTTASVTVNPTSVGGHATVAVSPICTGSSTTVTVTGYTGTIQWQQSADGSTGWATVTGGSGGTTATYTTPNLTATTYYRAAVTSGVCNSTYSTTAIVLMDNVPPTAVCKNITVQLNSSGTATIVASDVNNGSSDNCGIKNLAIDKTDFTCSNVGGNTVVLTVTDTNNNTATCSSTVTVQDKVAPLASCKNITVQLDATGNATIAEDAVNNGSTDACGGLTYDTDKTAFTCTNVGSNTVVLTVTDKNGNTATCSSTVTVQDKVAPVANCKNLTVQLDATGNATIAEDAVNNGSTDACGGLTYDTDKTAFTCTNVGSNTVVLTVTDKNGNTATCSSTVTVQDKVAPVANCKNITVQLDATGNATIAEDAVNNGSTDACGGLTFDTDKTSFTCTNVGANTVVLTVTDKNGNSSTCSSTVTVQDKVAPVANCKNITVQLDATGNATIAEDAVNNGSTDACGGLTFDTDKTSFTCTNVGANTVVLTVTDKNGNSSTCSSTVTVQDKVAPVANCKNITVQLDATGNATIAEDAVNNGSTDACGGLTFSTSKTSFTCANLGANTVTLTVTDKNGNSSTCSSTVTVQDKIAPSIAKCAVTRNIEGCNTTAITGPAYSATTTASTEAVFENATNQGSANDPCGITSVAYIDVASGTCPVIVTRKWTLSDASGNTSACNQTINVDDTTPPTFTRPPDITINRDAACQYDATISKTGDVTNEADNCSTLQATYKDEVITSGKCSIVIARTWSLADNCGNATADQVQTITVMDGTPPVLQTNNVCVYLSDYGLWALNEKDIFDLKVGTTDNCSGFNDLVFDISPRSFDCADIGSPVKVRVTAQDQCGNIGTGYSYVLVKDTIRPVALCKDTTVYLDKFNQAYVVPGAINRSNDWNSIPIWGKTFIGLNGGSYDNCAITEMYLDKQLFTGVDVGKNPVTLTVWDPSRNFRTCNAVVTVIDTITSMLVPVDNITLTVLPGVCSTKITYPEIKVKGSSPVTIEKIAGLGANGNFPLGTTLETWKATEQSGKITFASFTVTIQTYNAAPTINGVADIVVDEDAPAFEVPLSGMGYGIDCAAQQIVYLEVANSNTSLLSVTQEYVNGAASGKLKIIPLPDKNGEATITLTLKDNGGIANGGVDTTVKTFKITVRAVNDPPTVKTIPNQYVILPASLSVNVASAFIDADEGDVLTIKVTKPDGTALPSWMTFNPSTGLLTGTPTGANLGLTEVQILGTDKAGASIQEIFLVVVSDPNIATLKITAAKGTTQLTGGFTVNLYVKDGVLFNPVLNTPVFSGGTYTFYNLPVGTYFAEAVITDAILNTGLMNTYYESSASLTGAVQITLSAAETKSIQISMVSTTLNYGPNRILGKVIRRNGIPDPKVPPAGPGTPASGINLVLKYNGNIVATAITGADGKYVFDKLSPGNYEVAVELAGYTQDAIRKVSVYDDIQDSKADFTIWVSDNSHVITKITEVENPFEAVLYPNPTTGKVNIDLTRNGIRRVDVSVYNILGVQVFRNQYSAGDLITFDMSDKVTGIYMVKIEAEGRTIVKKLTLDRR